jgi:CheY-like chemotaxis protein
MLRREKKGRTVVHFGADRAILILRAWSLNEMGYGVLVANNALEAVKLVIQKRVDAVVLDLDMARNHDEVARVAEEIKRSRPRIPTILLAETTGQPQPAHALADALVPKRDDLALLVKALVNVFDVAGKPAKMIR